MESPPPPLTCVGLGVHLSTPEPLSSPAEGGASLQDFEMIRRPPLSLFLSFAEQRYQIIFEWQQAQAASIFIPFFQFLEIRYYN